MTRDKVQGVVIVGAGPGGLAPLFAAANRGELDDLLQRGVTLLERSFEVGAGALGQYAITSDSAAPAILDIVTQSREPALVALCSHPIVQAVAAYGNGAVPLALVGQFLKLAGEALCRRLIASPECRLIFGAQAQWVQQAANGSWSTRYIDASGQMHTVHSHSVLLATGAHQPAARLHTETVAGEPLLPTYVGKVVQSGDVLTPAGLANLERRLEHKREPRVAILGGSTSAASVAVALLTRLPNVQFGPQSVTLLHRRPLRLFYESVEEALREGYTEFGAKDVCPLTGRVYRLGGFRLDSRDLLMRLRGMRGHQPEHRVRLADLNLSSNTEIAASLREADVIIAALGYRPRLLPVLDSARRPVPLLEPNAARWAVVDQRCRVLTAEGSSLQGLFAMGLAIGPGASRELGGELDFRGQVNSLWLWQHTLGERVAIQVIERAKAAAKRPGQRFRDSLSAIDAPAVARPSAFQYAEKIAGAA